MNDRKMGTLILILLILMNLVLFGYYSYQKISADWVPIERIEQIRSLYSKNGIELTAELERRNTEAPVLMLGEANLDQMVENFLTDPFDKSYIYGSKVQYTSGSLVILTDRENNSISYDDDAVLSSAERNISVETWAMNQRISEEEAQALLEARASEFARKWLGEDIYLSKVQAQYAGYYFTYHPVQDNTVLYFNELRVYMLSSGVASADLICWEITGVSEKTYELMPIDEVLYAQLSAIKDDMKQSQKVEVVQIVDGYQLNVSDQQMKAVPSISIVIQSGEEYRMNRTAL